MNSPATPVSLSFSHLSSPPPTTAMSLRASSVSPASSTSSSPTDFIEQNQVQEDIFSNKLMEPMRNSFHGEEATVWGPGLLGLFVKSPSQFETTENADLNLSISKTANSPKTYFLRKLNYPHQDSN